MLNQRKFVKRLKCLYDSKHGNMENCFNQVDYLICVNDVDGNIGNKKSKALMRWVLGLHLSETIIVFGTKFIYFLSSHKRLLKHSLNDETLADLKNSIGVSVMFLETDGSKEHESSCKRLVNILKNENKCGKIGIFSTENYDSKFASTWYSILNGSGFTLIDLSEYAACAMSSKDEEELASIKKACSLTCQVYCKCLGFLVYLTEIGEVRGGGPLRNLDIAINVGGRACNGEYFPNEKKDAISFCYFPVIQSGGAYNLNLQSGSDENYYKDDIVIVSFGIRYQGYCSVLIRTVMIFPTVNGDVKENYKFLLQAYNFIIYKLQDGMKLNKLYQETVQFVADNQPELVKHLPDNFGSVIGLELEEKHLAINSHTQEIAKKNMIFNLNIGLNSIQNSDKTEKGCSTYSLWIGDTVKVNKGKPATILTNVSKTDTAVTLIHKRRFAGNE